MFSRIRAWLRTTSVTIPQRAGRPLLNVENLEDRQLLSASSLTASLLTALSSSSAAATVSVSTKASSTHSLGSEIQRLQQDTAALEKAEATLATDYKSGTAGQASLVSDEGRVYKLERGLAGLEHGLIRDARLTGNATIAADWKEVAGARTELNKAVNTLAVAWFNGDRGADVSADIKQVYDLESALDSAEVHLAADVQTALNS